MRLSGTGQLCAVQTVAGKRAAPKYRMSGVNLDSHELVFAGYDIGQRGDTAQLADVYAAGLILLESAGIDGQI